MTEQAEPMMTQVEAARRLRVTTRTVRTYIARGLLPAYRVKGTRTVRIERADVEALRQQIPVSERAS